MQNAAQAYSAVAKQIVNPRELEADLLLKAAARLQAVHDSWDQLQDTGRALAYLRRCVVAGSRSRLDRAAGGRAAAEPGPSRLGAGQMAPGLPGPALVSVLRTLPARQREAVVLCYYAGLPEPELAAVMGVSRWSARRHLAGALSALQGRLPAAALWPAPVLGPGG